MIKFSRFVFALWAGLGAAAPLVAQDQATTLQVVLGAEEPRNYPMGPIGGQYRVTDRATYARIVSIDAGSPGAAAGLLPGDCVLGAFGKNFPPTGWLADGRGVGNHAGVTQELGFAIERAEGGNGDLPLQVLRPGVGKINITVHLPRSGEGANPLYLLNSAKYDASYEKAVAHLHSVAQAGNAGGYFLGWTGLTLLGHPDWDKTTGTRPYRNSINKLRDAAVSYINSAALTGVEAYRYDSNAWTNGSAVGINQVGGVSALDSNGQGPVSGWYIGQYTMFLSEYLAKTYNSDDSATRTTVIAALQRALAQSANTIQWWRQPPAPGVGVVHEGELAAGMVGHGGVGGDYAHLGYALGINACGTHTFAGFSFARKAGQIAGNVLDFSVRPRDGHYFGYSDADYDALRSAGTANPMNTSYEKIGSAWTNVTNFKIVDPHAIFTNDPADVGTYHPGAGTARKIFTSQALPASTAAPASEHFDPSIHEKFLIQWNWVSIAAVGSEAADELHTGYIPWGCSAGEDVGKTSGSIIGAELYKRAGGTLRPDEEQRLTYLKNFITRHYIWMQDSHAYCLGAQAQWAFATPFLSDRQLQFSYENWSFYYALSRTFNDGFAYVRARYTNDNYLDETMCAAIDFALPHGIARGNYLTVPGFNPSRIVARFDNPNMRWPTIDARYVESNSRTLALPLTVFAGTGSVLNAADYTVTWSKVSGVGDVAFGPNNTLTFPADGLYRVKATITSGAYTLEEPIDVVVRTLSAPAGYALGAANYQVYKNITGTTVNSLIENHAYPQYSDTSSLVPRAEGTSNGDNYGSRLTGLIIAPAAGTYRFYIASDDASQLKLNFNGLVTMEGQVVAALSGAVNPARNFTALPSQQSAAFTLTEGQAIAFEALHKEGTGGDHLSVGWSINGGPIQVIEGYHLAYPVAANPSMKILTQPVSLQGVTGGTLTLSFTTEGPTPAMYQWRRNGVQIGDMTTTPSLTLANLSAGAEGNYDCTYTTPFGTLTTETVHVTVTDVGTIATGGLWREVYTGIGGSSVSDLTANAKYPYQADVSGVVTSAMTPSNYGDNYGQRLTGWITPPTSGSYRFFLASDDNSEVWLSTDSSPAKAVKIVSLSGYRGDRSWSTSVCSAYIPLVAGQKYFIQILHKEGGGGDNLAVAWQMQGAATPASGTGEIPGSVLSYRQGGIYPDTVLTNVAPVFLQSAYTAPQAYAAQTYAGFTMAGLAYDPNSTDFAGLTFSKVSGPAWLTVAANGALGGTPSATDVGANTFTVRVTDAGGLAGTTTVSITVLGANHAPAFVAATITAADAVAWMPYSGQTLASKVTDVDAWASFKFAKVSGPAWLNVAADGSLSGSPAYTDCGPNSFTVQVTDEGGLSTTATLAIVVRPLAVGLNINGVPAATTGTLTGFNKGQTVSLSPNIAKGHEVITKIDYYLDGTTLIGSSSLRPYVVSWPNLPPGTHTITLTFTTNVTAFATQSSDPVTLFVEYPPQVAPLNFVATSAMPVDKLIGQATATAATAGSVATGSAARTIVATGWSIVAGDPNGVFAVSNTGVITLKKPQLLPTLNVMALTLRATDNTGVTGDGVVMVICNPPWNKGVLEEQWNDGNQSSQPNVNWTGAPAVSKTIPTFYSNSGAVDCTRRFTGLLQPSVSGAYTFYLNSNDGGELYLSTDENPANKVKITNSNWWFEGTSSAINLVAGKVYYVEARNWCIGSGNALSVFWSGPGITKQQLPNSELFPNLAFAGTAWIGLNQPDNAAGLLAGVPIALRATTVTGASPITGVEFYRDGTLLGSTTTAPYAYVWTTPTAGTYVVKARALTAAGNVDSDPITITVGVNNDPLVDSDADGFNNGLETLLGSNPQLATSVPVSYFSGLYAWWNFDEASGSTATDTAYRSRDGVFVGTPTRVNGHSAKALALNGSTDGVLVGSNGPLSGTTDLTISTWIKTTSKADGDIIAQRDTASYNGQFILRATAAGRIYWYLYGDLANQFEFTTSTGPLVNDGAWHHIVAQREGLVGRVYVDNVLVGSATGAAVRNLNPSIALAIGYDNRDKSHYFNGLLDDLRIYTRALSAAEVTSVYQEPQLAPQAPYFTSNAIAWNAYSGRAIMGSIATYAYDVNLGLGGDALTFSKVAGPDWLAVAANGALSGTPAVANEGPNAFTVRVTDATNRTYDATLNVTVAPPPYWTNLAGGNWSDTANWSLGVIATGANETADFSQLDLTASTTVNLDTSRSIGALIFGDATPTHDWTLSTANSSVLTLSNANFNPTITVKNRNALVSTVIAGSGGLVKDGAGTLTLSGVNTYSGGTIVNGGTLVVTATRNAFNASVLAGQVTVNAGATLQMGSNPTGYGGGTTAINVNGGTVTGTGGLGAYGIVYNLTGGVIAGTSRMDIGTFNSVVGAINSFASSTTSTISNSGGILLRGDSSQTNITVTTEAGTTANGIDLEISSAISQYYAACGLTKAGPGTLALSGVNSYAGVTTVSAGTLLVTGSLTSATVTTVASGATLGGTGTLNGSATINGTLAPGAANNGIGTLSVKGTLTLAGNTVMGVYKNGATINADSIAGAASIVAGGTLTVVATNQAIGEGDTFTLFNVAPTGTFATVNLPTLPSYLNWQTADNYKTLTVVANITGRAANTINAFTTIPNQTFAPGKTVTVTVPTASSGLPVTLTVKSGPATISGNTLALTGGGTVVVAANQGGSASYLPATEVTTSFTVAKADQTITFNAVAPAAKGTASITLSATATSGLPVSFASANPAVATVAGNVLTILAAGNVTVTATQAGEGSYNAAPSVKQTIVINGDLTQAAADTAPAYAGVPLFVDVLANDVSASGALTIQSVSVPAHGTATKSGLGVIYKAAGGYTGSDSFTYTVEDGAGATATATVTVTVYNQYASLLALWRMNEGTGTVTADASTAGRTATLVGSPVWVDGRNGKGLEFASTNNLTATGATLPAGFTLAAWIKPANVSGTKNILAQNATFSLNLNGAGIRFTTPTILDYDTSTVTITANTWQHIAVTFTPNTTGGIKFYVNGVLRETKDTTGITSSANAWTVGYNQWSHRFAGTIDDAAIYGRLLTADEVALLAASTGVDATPVVPNISVASGDSYAVFTVAAAANQPVVLTMVDNAAATANLQTSPDGTTWSNYTANSRFIMPASGQVQVRTVNVTGKTFTLTAAAVDGSFGMGTSGKIQPNTIGTFAAVADQTYESGKTVTVTEPTATSGLPVTLTVKSGPATISGNVVTLTGAGTVVLAANQAGNATYDAATEVTTSFAVAKGTPNITWPTPAAITYGTALNATQLNATADVAGTFSYSAAVGTVLAAGTPTVTATFTPANTVNYTTATKTVTLTVNKAVLTVTADNKLMSVGGSIPTLTVSYGTFVNGDTATAVTAPSITTAATSSSPAGMYAITLSGGSAANYALTLVPGTLTVVSKVVPTITWATPTAITYGTALSAVQLNASTSVAGTFAYSPAAGAVPGAGTSTLTATFTPTDTAAYASATQTVTLTVNKAPLTVTADNKSMTAGGTVPALTASYGTFVNGDTAAAVTAPAVTTSATSASVAGTYPITLSGGSAANYALTLVPGTLTVNAASNAAPTISVQPQSQVATTAGGTVNFSVTASGSPTPSYQWYRNGTAVTGATSATLALTNVQAANVGNYWVVVSNAAGSVTSNLATFSLTQAGNSATQAVVGVGYVAGQTVTVTNTLTYAGTPSALSWSVLLPPGFSFASSTGSVGSTGPQFGDTQVLNWAWATVPASPVTFTYTLNVADTVTGRQELVSLVGVRNGESLQFLAQPDPLAVTAVARHAADTDQDGRIGLLELTRMIELYNTRNGSVRTGCYAVAQTSTEDGYASEGTRSPSALATLSRYHTADTNRDGKISLFELTRVIELYNYRAVTTRTGQYRLQVGSEDGFAPGP